MNYLTDEDDLSLKSQDDEIKKIKSVMRIANGRKTAYNKHFQSKIEKHPVDNEELRIILKKQTIELNKTKSKLSECELELKETKFEMFQLQEKEKKIWEEKKIIEFKSNEIINHLKAKIEQRSKNQDNKDQVALFECRKLIKTFNTLEKATNIDNNCVTGVSRITKNLFEKANMDIIRLTDVITNKATTETAYSIASKSAIYSKPLTNVDVSCENAMLDMCRSLEEENRTLSDSIDHLRLQLVDANKEASINKLIPHYRLAIVRSRTYAANLLEQLNREKEISNTLRSQLELTYTDLKRVVEEKRQLYIDTSTPALQADEQAFLTTTTQSTACIHLNDTNEKKILNKHTQSTSTTFNKDVSTNTTHSSVYNDIIEVVQPEIAHLHSEGAKEINTDNIDLKNRILISNKLSQSIENENLMNYLNTNSSQLKSELGKLDHEIEQLKIKLGKAAMIKSKQIINEVLDSQLTYII